MSTHPKMNEFSPCAALQDVWEHYPLDQLIKRVYRAPGQLADVDSLEAQGCTAIVVSCHCFLVRDVSPGLKSLHHAFLEKLNLYLKGHR
jgi:hypothetical protein